MLGALAAFYLHFAIKPRHDALAAGLKALRTVVATLFVFGLGGFGLVRLLLPVQLRRYELLWVVPTGACAAGLALTVLGFAAVPYEVALAVVLVAGVALGAFAVRRRGWPAPAPLRLAWPLLLSFIALFVAITQMVFIRQFAAPVGYGSDAHVATGVAQLLQHTYPTGTNLSQPINQMQPAWQSKYPIYYAFAAVATIAHLPTWQVLTTLAGMLLAIAAVGMFLVAREVFGAPVWVALFGMAFAALGRITLFTVLHPYFNQTWGFCMLPFTLVLGWWSVQPGLSRSSRRAAFALLAVFALVLVLAYPLAAPIPAVPLIVFAWGERRRRRAAGEQLFRLRDVYRGRRSLVWIVPVAALLAVPVAGAVDKALAAAKVVAPGSSLSDWGGDMQSFIAWNHFFSLPNSWLGWALFAGVLLLAVLALAGQPRSLAWGLGGLILLGLLIATYFRHRQVGYYFEFKLLAFLGPLILLIAAVGAGRLRRGLAVVPLAVLTGFVCAGAVAAVKDNGVQLDQATIQLAGWARSLPRGASIRLDMSPAQEIWVAYFLVSHPVCSQLPLLGTDYPHVALSRKADYIVASRDYGRPADAAGPVLRINDGYRLFRQKAGLPGVSTCSRRRFDRSYSGVGHAWR